ncbi:acetylcholine receptor subunit alpha-L1-like [Dreissena polymorpha]|uniref:acetylcholine receptor subunit alpha-L1-like n=1 Tax=Dreissena polymorpha TaxID=45954 RepID=UPI002265006C|nr:acetylcholine receptor subunit alpha-L1-like [Dreissena polymorpha]
MTSSLIVLFVFIGHASHVVTQSGNDAKRLHQQLFVSDTYNKRIRPIDNQSSAIDVYANLHLLSINELSETDEVLTTTAVLSMSWNDTFLKWDPNTFGGIKFYYWPQNEVWKPDIALQNSYLDYKGLGDKTLNVMNIHTGAMYWNPFQVFKSTCSLDIFYFPFDYQTCYLRFQAWSYSRRQVNMESGYRDSQGFDLDYYETNSEWDIVNTSWHVYRDQQDAAINFKMTLKRKPINH